MTPKPEKGSLDEKYAESVMKSFIPRMPLESPRKPTDAFSEGGSYPPSLDKEIR